MRKVDKSELGREIKKNVRNIMPDYATQFPPDSIPRVHRVLSGQNSRTFKYISRTKLQNSRTFFNLLICKLNVLLIFLLLL